MTDYLLANGHWAFIAVSYFLFFFIFAWDWAGPWLKQRRLKRDIIARLRREQLRKAP